MYHIKITETYRPWYGLGFLQRSRIVILHKETTAEEAWNEMAELRMAAMYNPNLTVEMVDDE